MSSLQSLRELISERLAAAAEEICRLCEGTIVQYEQELCRQRRLLDICWKPQLQLHHIVLPQHYATEEEDLSNQQMNSRVEQEEPEPSQIEMEQRESEPLEIKEEQEGLCISQIEEQLDLKQETDTLIEIFTYKGNEYSEADLNNQQTFNIHSEEGNQHEESTSTAYGETEPQSQWSFKKETLFEKSTQLPKEKRLSFAKSRIAPSVSVYMRTESDKIPCICEECGKSFDCWSKFRLHMRSHTGEKPFSCKVCAKSFSHMSNLKTHMRTHTGEKPFSCKICDKSFSQVSTLRTHMRIHTGEKPFSCKLCDASFSNITHLKTHIRTHTGEKPFSCKECHRSFSQNSSLKIHMRTHTGEKPFFCKECDKCFSQKSNLKAHMRTHPGKKLFPSEEFDTSFSQTPNLEDTRSRTS